MNSAINHPSCIKIPSTNSKQSTSIAMFSQKFDVKEELSFNYELISLANEIFGEGKWSHTVTNQTIDFVEAFMGKYVCGCVTFIRIQLQNGTFHEDIGYCHAEGTMKGLAIHHARIGSLTDAFKKVLSCFGHKIRVEIQKLSKKLSNSHINNVEKEDLHFSISDIQTDTLEPCAQSTMLLAIKNDEQKVKPENVAGSKNPNDQGGQISVQKPLTRLKSPTEQKGPSVSVKASDGIEDQLRYNDTSYQKEQNNVQKTEDKKKALTEDELLRLERKRKQMEKQAEYKRLMKEKEKQKVDENKKFNLKY